MLHFLQGGLLPLKERTDIGDSEPLCMDILRIKLLVIEAIIHYVYIRVKLLDELCMPR